MKHYTIPIFVTNYGCNFKCIYCNQETITNREEGIKKEGVISTIEEYLSYFDEKAFIEIGFFGGSFTGIDLKTQREFLNIAKNYKDKGLINEIRLSTRPDLINEDILNLLKDHSVDTIELGVQSLDEEVLKYSARGHNSSIVYKSSKMIKEKGFNLGLQMMIGLPKDSKENVLFTAREFVKLKADCVRIYPTVVIKNTPLELLYYQGNYKPLNLEETIEITKEVIKLFELNNINIIRVGLQSTDDIALGKSVISGPYHPSFRELVESRIYRDIIESKIKKDTRKIEIETNNKNISKIIGNKKTNVTYFKNKYKVKEFKIINNENLKDKNINIIIDDKKIEVDYLNELKEVKDEVKSH